MNYVMPLSTLHCHCCGDEHPTEAMFEIRGEVVCAACKTDHDSKTEQADTVEFRLLSLEWLKKGTYLCDDCGVCPDQLIERYCGDRVCAKCDEVRDYAEAERQEEANNEAFYGGSAPFTAAEIWEANEKEERGY